MRKSAFRSASHDSQAWVSSEATTAQKGNLAGNGGTVLLPEVTSEWLPESVLRDALIAERLPATVVGRNLFWVNIRQYLSHNDAQLPPEQYLRHWREIYRSCLNEDTAWLSGLSYVSVEGPVDGSELN